MVLTKEDQLRSGSWMFFWAYLVFTAFLAPYVYYRTKDGSMKADNMK